MKNADIGVSLGLIYGLGGAAGTYAGGYLTDHFGKKDRRFYLTIPAYGVLLSMLFIAGTILLQSLPLTLFCLGAVAFLQSMYLGPSLAVAHSLVAAPMRALTSAVLFFVLNFFGQGFGPLIVGLISDALKPQFGIESLRWALSILLIMAFGAAMMFFAAAKKLRTAGIGAISRSLLTLPFFHTSILPYLYYHLAAPPSIVRQIPLTKDASSDAR